MRGITGIIAAVAGGVLIAAATPAAACPTPAASLKLTYGEGEAEGLASAAGLTCEPTGGNHPHASAACAQLIKVKGYVENLNVNPKTACIMLYAPVSVTATGTWKGRAVKFAKTYGNSCELHAKTGEVFKLKKA